MKKRFMSAFLAVIMLFSMLSTTAFAASSEEEALGEINIFNGGVTMSYRDAGDAKVYTVTEKVLTKLFDRKPSIYTPPRTPYLTGKGDVIDAPLIKTAGKTGGSHRK